ncbi:histidine phosphatase family protein [Antrihabitans cavernicola]|uniref:Histidine phosphatase family protein n=1 Tax=Antrihabitans cavernicola TaxID=2495913 RepID=A0A5A7SGQ9_9NOCA|nr:histidine phosphatase family protein [Spelaeibacter cavernicola]KAA0024804.1 histidine phosphatase family protein [Spelaeibacter cavernicola]
MQLLLIRHALPLRIDNAADGANPALAELGAEQAQRVPDALARHRISRVVSSPQLRAQQTAAPTALGLRLPVDLVPGIAEYDHGTSSYVPIEEAKTEFRAQYDRIKRGDLPEGVDPQAFITRVVDAVAGIAAAADHSETVAAFAHGGVINAYLQNVLDTPRTLMFPIDYCSITRILFSRSGRRTVAAVNETAHVWDLLPRNIAEREG